MIELRWVERVENCGNAMSERTYCELQYRETNGRKTNGYGEEINSWTKWFDVPTVSSEDAGDS